METIEGTIDYILFPKKGQPQPDNGFAIASLKPSGNTGSKGNVSVKGSIPGIHVGMAVKVTGDWKSDSYGTFLSVRSYEEKTASSVDGIRNYIASGIVKGIGEATAAKIVDKFGEDTVRIIEQEPERLFEVKGLTKKQQAALVESWKEHEGVRNVMIFLKTYGVGNANAARIYKKYGTESISVLKSNPYVLADDIDGIGFLTADSIAMAMGIDRRNPGRIRSAVLYAMNDASEKKGHVYHVVDELTESVLELLNNSASSGEEVTGADVLQTIAAMKEKKDIISEGENGERLFVPMFYHAERNVAQKIALLCKETEKAHNVDFAKLEKQSGIAFDDVQKDAISLASTSRFCVITGGPGTGKTTTMKGVIEEAKGRGLRVLLAAPTGRASRRLAETTGMGAKTIHRLLEYMPGSGFGKDDENPLVGDLLVVDESSMIDVLLMHSLLKAVPLSMRVVLVGDVDQLPSVGAGNVLRDIIDSDCVPVVRLTRIFRQAQGSLIVSNAHAVNEGRAPALPCDLTPQGEDFCFVQRDDAAAIQKDIVTLVSDYIPAQFDYHRTDIQVLSPMRKGPLGTEELNRILQDVLNPSDEYVRYGAVEFRKGDRVMQTKNNYEWDVFNGDVGRVTDVDPVGKKIVIDFDGTVVEAKGDKLASIDLAYACTIHKSQGSEYPVVIVPVSMSHYVMLQRNLLYTAITRAKKRCVLVGDKRAVMTMVGNNVVKKRNSTLKERLRRYLFCHEEEY